MKKVIIGLFIITSLIFSFQEPIVIAQTIGTLTPPLPTRVTVTGFVETVVNFALGSGVAVFLIYFMIGALQWITSAGDKAALEHARGRMTHATIGLIMLASIWAIFSLIQTITFTS
jgi:hypothetical protein